MKKQANQETTIDETKSKMDALVIKQQKDAEFLEQNSQDRINQIWMKIKALDKHKTLIDDIRSELKDFENKQKLLEVKDQDLEERINQINTEIMWLPQINEEIKKLRERIKKSETEIHELNIYTGELEIKFTQIYCEKGDHRQLSQKVDKIKEEIKELGYNNSTELTLLDKSQTSLGKRINMCLTNLNEFKKMVEKEVHADGINIRNLQHKELAITK